MNLRWHQQRYLPIYISSIHARSVRHLLFPCHRETKIDFCCCLLRDWPDLFGSSVSKLEGWRKDPANESAVLIATTLREQAQANHTSKSSTAFHSVKSLIPSFHLELICPPTSNSSYNKGPVIHSTKISWAKSKNVGEKRFWSCQKNEPRSQGSAQHSEGPSKQSFKRTSDFRPDMDKGTPRQQLLSIGSHVWRAGYIQSSVERPFSRLCGGPQEGFPRNSYSLQQRIPSLLH